MAGVEVATLGWGVLQNERGDALSGLTPTISGTVYSDQALTTPLPAASWISQSDGTLPGYMAAGQYTFTEPVDGTSRTVDVVGGVNIADAVQANLDAHVAESPLNVKDYGAVGDGVADDTAEIQAALTAAAASGGTVYFPAGVYLVSSTLSLADARSVTLLGGGGRADFSSPSNMAELIYTPASGSLLSLASAQGISLERLWFAWTDTTYTDKLVSTDHSATGGDTSYCTFRGCRFGQKGASPIGTADMVHLKQSIIVSFYDCVFARGGRAIVGRDPNTTYANVIGVYSCTFAQTSDYPVYNPGEAWTLINNTFEPRTGGLAGSVGTSGPGDNFCRGFNYQGNWHGDVTVAGSNWINGLKPLGANISGNYFGTIKGGDAAVNLADAGQGVAVTGNRADGSASAIGVEFAGDFSRAMVMGNDLQVDTPIAGATGVTGGLVARAGGATTVASAAALDLVAQSEAFHVTGTTGITSVTGGWTGRQVVLKFTGILTVTDGSNLKLNGNLTTAANTTLTLYYDGSNWIETGRSVN